MNKEDFHLSVTNLLFRSGAKAVVYGSPRKLKIQKESYAPLMVYIFQDAYELTRAYELTPAILK